MLLRARGWMERAHTTLRFGRFEEGAESVSRGQDRTAPSAPRVLPFRTLRGLVCQSLASGEGMGIEIQLGQRTQVGP